MPNSERLPTTEPTPQLTVEAMQAEVTQKLIWDACHTKFVKSRMGGEFIVKARKVGENRWEQVGLIYKRYHMHPEKFCYRWA